jgi:hypothetical protein
MSTPNKYDPASNVLPMLIPRCPHCSAELPAVSLFNWQCGPWIILCVYCSNPECRKTLTYQIVPVGLAAEESKIHQPS